jgi:hypothetical protein
MKMKRSPAFPLLILLALCFSSCTGENGLANSSAVTMVPENTAQPVLPTQTEIPATATTEPITSDNALSIAWRKLKDAQSLTSITVEKMVSSTEEHVFETTCKIDIAGQVWLETMKSSIDLLNKGEYGSLYVDGNIYQKDATEVYKFDAASEWQIECVPEIQPIKITLDDLRNSEATYMSEMEVGGVQTYQYGILLADELMTREENVIMKDTPEVYAYVDRYDGELLKMSVTFMKLTNDAYYDYQIDSVFSGLNETNLELPEYAEEKSTAMQSYSGSYAEYLNFEYPINYELSEYSNPALGVFSLASTGGGTLHWSDMAEWNFDTADGDDETRNSICRGYANEVVLVQEQNNNPLASIDKAEWINTENLGFCHIVVAGDEVKSLYFFNAPQDSALQNSLAERVIFSHATFLLTLTSTTGTAVDDQFTDLINSLAFK